jgi:ubiquinone/menaquinone biosynthesis C-methylase UbiE
MPKEKRIPGWLLDEVTNAGRENLDPVHVGRYDQKEDAGAADELAVLTGLGLSDDSVVVDLGAGTGQFALAAARLCRRVVAVEVSPVMLEALMRRIDEERVANIYVVGSGFLTYEHEGPLADFAYSRYALHHLPDFWKAIALDRIRRILRPGGVFRL